MVFPEQGAEFDEFLRLLFAFLFEILNIFRQRH